MSLPGAASIPRLFDASRSPNCEGLRVLALTEFVPSDSCGGSDHVVWQVYRRIAAWGASVTVVSCVPQGHDRVDETMAGVHWIGVPSWDVGRVIRAEATVSLPLVPEVFRAARRLQPAVVHANSLHFQSTVVGALVARRRRYPLVTTAHIASLRHLAAPVRTAVGLYEQSVGRVVLGSSAHVIAVSASVRDHLRSLGVPESKITVVPNGVDTSDFRPRARHAANAVPRVAFVGRIIPNKGPDILVRALADLARTGVAFDAVIVGEGPSRRALEKEVVDRGLGDRVKLTGHVRDVASILGSVDVLVRPSLTEGMPLAVLEAMASGVCVVASDVEGNNDLIEHERNGLLFAAGHEHALADALRRALCDAPFRRQLASRALSTAASFSWDACAASTAAVLATAVSKG